MKCSSDVFTEHERIRLYNDLCDYREEVKDIYPPQTRRIDTLTRAIQFVRGTTGVWKPTAESEPILINGRAVGSTNCVCSVGGETGRSNYRLCPQCGAKMHR